jgi:hypothetical protein
MLLSEYQRVCCVDTEERETTGLGLLLPNPEPTAPNIKVNVWLTEIEKFETTGDACLTEATPTS